MKRIGIVGQSTLDKSFFMMYLGKLLSQDMSVALKTQDRWYRSDLEAFEFSDRFMVGPEVLENDVYDILLIDFQNCQKVDRDIDRMICITQTDRLSMEYNKRLLEFFQEVEERQYVFMNLLMDSKITVKYLAGSFGIDRKVPSVYGLYLSDSDLSLHIENGYNQRLNMKHLSKAYRQLLLDLVLQWGYWDSRQIKGWHKKAERSK